MVPHIFLWHMSFMTLIIFLVFIFLYSHLTSEIKVHTHSSHSLKQHERINISEIGYWILNETEDDITMHNWNTIHM